VDDHLERGRDLLADRLVGQRVAGHQDQVLEAVQCVARAVRVDRGERSVMARVHGLEHVQHLVAAHLADHDAVGTHTERVPDEVALRDRAASFDVRRTGLEPHHVRLLELELRRVLDRDDALALGDVAREDVEERRLAGARTARDQGVDPRADDPAEEPGHRLRQGAELEQVLDGERLPAEAADREDRAVQRGRLDDRVHARAVREPGVDQRARLVDTTADPRDDAVDDEPEVRLVPELDRGQLELSEPLHVHLAMRVHQDVRDLLVEEVRRDRTEIERVVEELLHEPLLVGARQAEVGVGQEPPRDRFHLVPATVLIQAVEEGHVELADHLAMEAALQLLVLVQRRRRARTRTPVGRFGFSRGGRDVAGRALAETIS